MQATAKDTADVGYHSSCRISLDPLISNPSLHPQIVGRIQVGALPVHGYNVPQLSQFWAHSDINGTFSVIDVNNVNATAAIVAVSPSALSSASQCTLQQQG